MSALFAPLPLMVARLVKVSEPEEKMALSNPGGDGVSLTRACIVRFPYTAELVVPTDVSSALAGITPAASPAPEQANDVPEMS